MQAPWSGLFPAAWSYFIVDFGRKGQRLGNSREPPSIDTCSRPPRPWARSHRAGVPQTARGNDYRGKQAFCKSDLDHQPARWSIVEQYYDNNNNNHHNNILDILNDRTKMGSQRGLAWYGPSRVAATVLLLLLLHLRESSTPRIRSISLAPASSFDLSPLCRSIFIRPFVPSSSSVLLRTLRSISPASHFRSP